MIYKICPLLIWREAECQGSFPGAGIDRRDGYIHFSTAGQLRETVARHFRGPGGARFGPRSRCKSGFLAPRLNGNQRETGLSFPTSTAISR